MSHPDIDIDVIRRTGPMPAWLTAITPFLDPQSDIRYGSMTLYGSVKDFQALTQLLELHLPGAVIRRRVAHQAASSVAMAAP